MPSFWPFQETTEPAPVEIARSTIEAKDVELYTSPWVSGTRAVAYFGPISLEAKFKRNWERTLDKAILAIQTKAAVLGANSVVGVELSIDPFAEPATLLIVGTAASLEPLFQM